MSFLLDTHIVLWAGLQPESLSQPIQRAIRKGPAFISVVALMEVAIKAEKGKLRIADPRKWWADIVMQLDATVLPVRSNHVSLFSTLPTFAPDPFDRLVIAQAITEDMTLLSRDTRFPPYRQAGLRLID